MSNREQDKVLVRCRGCHKKYYKQKTDLERWRGLCAGCERDRQRGKKSSES
jgi:hypothetical protein